MQYAPRVTILKCGGEYRVPGPEGTEAQAYYTNDKQDAIDTARHIASTINGASAALSIVFRSVPQFP